jgi:hypothetical protein
LHGNNYCVGRQQWPWPENGASLHHKVCRTLSNT